MTDRSHADVRDVVRATFAEDQGRTVASLIRSFGDLSLAEESVQDAYAKALVSWETQLPDNTAAWILTTARNAAIDRLRRAGRLEVKTAEMAVELDRRQRATDGLALPEVIADDRLRLIFLCTHPALSEEAGVALTLRLVAGLTTPRIARAHLVKEATMAARLTRAKKKIAAAGIGFRMPADHELGDRLSSVLRVLYLTFTQGHLPADGDDLVDTELVDEAVRLARLVARLMPDEPEVLGLLALMLLVDARRATRVRAGRLVRLADQDRHRWDRGAIEEGLALIERALRRGRPGPYQLQAAIQAVHAEAEGIETTDWPQIVGLYRALQVMNPSPVVALNLAVAVHTAQGPEAGLAALDSLGETLDGYHLLHAARGEMLLSDDRPAEALAAFERAAELTGNAVERRYLADRLASFEQ